MRKIIVFSILLFTIINDGNAQLQGQARIDSLLKELPKMKEDSNAVNLLVYLSFFYYSVNPDEGIKYARQGLEISDKISWKLGKARCYNTLGINYNVKSEYSVALENYHKSLKINEELGYKDEISKNLSNIGVIYNLQSEHSKALEYFQKAYKIDENLGDKSGVARNLGNIGITYSYLSDYSKALEYYHKSLKLNEELGRKPSIAMNLGNIGSVYATQSEYTLALEYFKRALEINKELGRKSGVSHILGNIGNIYLNQARDSIIQLSENRTELLQNRDRNIINAINNLSEAVQGFEESGNIHEQSIFLKSLSQAYELKGDYKKAYKEFIKHKTLQDSVFNMDKAKDFANLESKRELEIKEKENQLLLKDNQLFNAELLQKNQKISLAEREKEVQHLAFLKELAERQEKEKQLSLSETQMKLQQSQIETLDKDKERQNAELEAKNLQRNFLIAGAIVFIILFLIAFVRFREKKKLSEQLAIQKNEIENQKSLLEEKNTEIVDSINYAATIQNALLPWSSVLKNNFKEHFILFKPKDIVSGDSYWFQEVDGIKYMAVIDCTGHGVPGSMLTVIANSVLDDAVLSKKLTSTSEILTYMNEKVTEVLNQRLAENKIRDGMEVCLIAIHNDKIQYSGAGRPLFVKNGKFETIKTDKHGIAGQTDNDEYQFSAIEIEKSDNLLLYLSTDGFADQMNESSKKYSTKRFLETLDRISELPLDKQNEILENEFNSHKGNREQIDDVTILGVRI